MELAKITTKGQITIPIQIRKALNLKDGDKVVFMQDGNSVFIANAAMIALDDLQKAFLGEAARVGIKDEQDIVKMVREVRHEMLEERNGRDA